MAIKERSFRIGSGRYVQEAGAIEKCGEEVLRLGRAPFIIGGKTALSVAGERITDSILKSCKKYETAVYTGTCNDEEARRFSEYAKNNGFDVIVGVGGGVMMDFAKLCGYYSELPVLNIPTSCATCAAYTPLSVRYTKNGETVGTLHYTYEVDGVIADSDILRRAPVRLFLSGVFDSLAKYIEIQHRYKESDKTYTMGLDYAYATSRRLFDFLMENTEGCIGDIRSGERSDRLENAFFSLIAVTGTVSGIARGSDQTALAHKLYEITRLLYPRESRGYLHGELVGIGLLLQCRYNGDLATEKVISSLMRKYGMPSSPRAVGIPKDSLPAYLERISGSSAMEHATGEEYERLKESLEYLWRLN